MYIVIFSDNASTNEVSTYGHTLSLHVAHPRFTREWGGGAFGRDAPSRAPPPRQRPLLPPGRGAFSRSVAASQGRSTRRRAPPSNRRRRRRRGAAWRWPWSSPRAAAAGPATAARAKAGSDRAGGTRPRAFRSPRSEEHTSELQSLMRISYAVFC